MPTTAILGASGHIARGLAAEYLAAGDTELVLYARRPDAVGAFVATVGQAGPAPRIEHLDRFGKSDHDVVINAIGAGDPKRVADMGREIEAVTASFDDAVLTYLAERPATRYVFLSSGIVHTSAGRDQPGAAYAAAKIEAERKHRLLASLNIVDIRVFSIFSRFIDITGDFFMAQVARAVAERRPLVTDARNMVRDYCVPADLAQLIAKVCAAAPLNAGIELYSRAPADKFTLLERIAERFDFRYSVDPAAGMPGGTASSNAYFAHDHAAAALGYAPRFDTIEGVLGELAEFRPA